MKKNNFKLFINYIITTIIVFFIYSCASIVAPSGGKKDITPPKVENFEPENKSTNFNAKEIKIVFDEFFDLKDATNQILISPPISKKPDIKVKSKSLVITFKDTLQKNSTYNIDFGESIADINENNFLLKFNYTFSTGNSIDSMIVQGKAINAFDLKDKSGVFVLLYNNNDDSIPFKNMPKYVAKTNELGFFKFPNISDGKYKIFAIKDINENQLYDLPEEEIAFIDSLAIPFAKDTIKKTEASYLLNIFKEEKGIQHVLKAFSLQYGKIQISFNKPTKDLQIRSLNNNFTNDWKFKEFNKNKDTLLLWINEPVPDTMIIELKDNDKIIDTISVTMTPKIVKNKSGRGDRTSAKFGYQNNIKSNLFDINKNIEFEFSQPLTEYDISKINVYQGKDTLIKTKIFFTDSLKRKLSISYNWKESQMYYVFIQPEIFKDIYEFKNDTIKFNFKTKALKEYAKLILNVNLKETTYQYILQLMNEKGNIIKENIITQSAEITYDFLDPAKYTLKLIHDTNNDSKWSTGIYLKHIQPEKIEFFKESLNLKANWDTEMDWNIEDKSKK